METENKTINIVSNVLVHTATGEAVGPWYIFQDHQQQLKVKQPIKLQPFSHSYHVGIKTAHYAFIDARKLPIFDPHPMTILMDCESGITKLQSEINSPKDVMTAEMDLVLANKHTTERMPQEIQL